MWFLRWISTLGKRTSSSSSNSGIYTTLAGYLNQGTVIKNRSGRAFACKMSRSILGELVLTVEMRECNICSSSILDFQRAHAAYEDGPKSFADYIHFTYEDMIAECVQVYDDQLDSLCDRLFS
jgi:hypothetical protein